MLIDALRGAVAGAVATWLMDQVTTGILEQQPDEVTRQEEQARPGGKSSVTHIVDRIEDATGFPASDEQRPAMEMGVHYSLGVVPGAVYGVVRRRLPFVGAGRGVVYGALLWAVMDEYANARLGLAGPFDAYPAETHFRGFVGHVVLGMTTDTVIHLLGGGARRH